MKENNNNDYPKVLVISHNPFSTKQNNGKTLSAFFEGWPKDKIAQLFLTLDEIDTTICENYFRISDVDVFKNVINKNRISGKKIDIGDLNNVNKDKEKEAKGKIYSIARDLTRRKNIFIWWLRTLMWKKSKPWKSIEFINWLKEFSPDIVFFQSSNFYTIFNMVQDIVEMTNSNLYIETTDDYVTPRFTLNILTYIKDKKMEKYYKKLVDKSECVFAIGEKMAQEYKNRFGGNYEIAMNSIDVNSKVKEYLSDSNSRVLTYAGNLGLNRWKILYKLGKILNKLNTENSIQSKLIICSLNVPSKKVMKKFKRIDCIEYKGALNSKQLVELRNNSDVLVHVEAFDKKNKKITRLSISTKIPEYMLSKRCILAIGPSDVASIDYINSNEIGMVITNNNKEIWVENLKSVLYNDEIRYSYIDRAYKLALKNHMYGNNKKKVQMKIINKEK